MYTWKAITAPNGVATDPHAAGDDADRNAEGADMAVDADLTTEDAWGKLNEEELRDILEALEGGKRALEACLAQAAKRLKTTPSPV